MCGRVAPASNGGVRSHKQQLARRLAALEDRGERWRCAVALAGIVVQRERLARAFSAELSRLRAPDSADERGLVPPFSAGSPEPLSLGKQPALSLSVRFQLANGSETYGTYPRRTAGALGRALRVRGALGSSRQKWPKRPISSSYRPYAAWLDAFQTLVHV